MKFPAFEAIDLKSKIEPLAIMELPLTAISACPNQPRKVFKEEELQELADSIEIYGVLQPIIVKKIADNQYQIIAGERRWRASKLAGESTILAIIRPECQESQENIAVSLIENIQREGLNPIELALTFLRLQEEHNLSHEEIGKLVGKRRATVTNILRLLTLSDHVQNLLSENKIDIGHAKVLMTLPEEEQVNFAQLLVDKKISVRDVERMVHVYKKKLSAEMSVYNNMIHDWQEEIAEYLSAKVRVNVNNKGAGKFIVHFASVEEGNRLLDLFLDKTKTVDY